MADGFKLKKNGTYSCLKYLKANSIIENFPSSELELESKEWTLCKSSNMVDPIGLDQARFSGIFGCNINVYKIKSMK